MVARVAKAIEAQLDATRPRTTYLEMARAAIAAMKDAHPLLRAAADLNHVDLDEEEAKQILEDMITEALK